MSDKRIKTILQEENKGKNNKLLHNQSVIEKDAMRTLAEVFSNTVVLKGCAGFLLTDKSGVVCNRKNLGYPIHIMFNRLGEGISIYVTREGFWFNSEFFYRAGYKLKPDFMALQNLREITRRTLTVIRRDGSKVIYPRDGDGTFVNLQSLVGKSTIIGKTTMRIALKKAISCALAGKQVWDMDATVFKNNLQF